MENKPEFDEVDLNRLYESISKQIEAYNCARAGVKNGRGEVVWVPADKF